jgi:hypothetical protein
VAVSYAECVTTRRYEDMTEHSCYLYRGDRLVRALTVRVYYHRTRITAKIVAYSELEARAWRPFERELSRRLSEVMPKPSEDRVVNSVLEEFFEELVAA